MMPTEPAYLLSRAVRIPEGRRDEAERAVLPHAFAEGRLPQVLPANVDGCLACAGYSLDLKHVRIDRAAVGPRPGRRIIIGHPE
jgi:hypothetical protein